MSGDGVGSRAANVERRTCSASPRPSLREDVMGKRRFAHETSRVEMGGVGYGRRPRFWHVLADKVDDQLTHAWRNHPLRCGAVRRFSGRGSANAAKRTMTTQAFTDKEAVRRCGPLGQPDGANLVASLFGRAAKGVSLILYDQAGDRREITMGPAARGYFEHREPGVASGQRYAYKLDGGLERPDPCSLSQPDGVHGPSAVVRPEEFIWSDGDWKGVRREDLVFYELHVGTFTNEGTFDAIIPRLPQLKDLGITAVEIMPVAQFPNDRNWGYDGVLPYAAQNTYGSAHGLARLVDACHTAGLAIFLDVVYNHMGPEGNYTGEFGPYLTDHYKTPWGMGVNYDVAGCDAVRDYVIDNARMWLEEFHFDGLRLDAIHAIYDNGARHILAHQAGSRTHCVAAGMAGMDRGRKRPE